MFDAKVEKTKIVNFIRNYFSKNNLGGVVIGISGGKDSSVVAGLFTEALGSENVIGVSIPCYSNNSDREDAIKVANRFGFKLINMDITSVFDSFVEEAKKLDDFIDADDANINLKPRLRMSTLYYIAQMYSKRFNKVFVVAGCGNKSEEYVGYFTKGGDSVSDIKVISDLFVDEVIKLGEELGVPEDVLYKAPSDGLSGMSDEEKLGFSYDDVKKVVLGQESDENIKSMIENRHVCNSHKFNIPEYKRCD